MTTNPSAPTPGNSKSAHVVLVHGAWADGSSWSKVIALLQAKGVGVTAVQLALNSLAGDVATVVCDQSNAFFRRVTSPKSIAKVGEVKVFGTQSHRPRFIGGALAQGFKLRFCVIKRLRPLRAILCIGLKPLLCAVSDRGELSHSRLVFPEAFEASKRIANRRQNICVERVYWALRRKRDNERRI